MELITDNITDNFTVIRSVDNYSHLIPPPTPNDMDKFRFIINSCAITILVAFGLLGNTLSFIVYLQHRHRTSTTFILKALAVSDSLVLISNLFLMSLRYVYQYTGHAMAYMMVFPYVFRVVYPCLYIVRGWTTWFTVLLTFDRYSVVCKPLEAHKLCTRFRTCKYLSIIVVSLLVYSIPRFFEYYLETDEHQYVHYKRSALTKNQIYTMTYRIISFLIVMYLIPISVLSYCNVRLILTLRKAQQSRSEMVLLPQRFDITSLVVMVVSVFIACNVPAFVSHIIWALEETFPNLRILQPYRRYISHISNLMVTVNSAVNFLIYCLCSASFRETLRGTLRKCFTCRCRKTRRNKRDMTSLNVWYRQNSCTISNGRHISLCQSQKCFL